MRLLILSALLLCMCYSYAQNSTHYQPLKDDLAQIKVWEETLEKQHRQLVSKLPSNFKTDLQKIYDRRYSHLKELTQKNRLVTDSLANNYLQQMVNMIFSSNPSINSTEYRIRFTRDYWPNAASMGEGTIIFNIGLFSKLQNESQVAFVLCHEIAHYYLQHSQNSINHYVATINSKEHQDELKRIMKSEYRQGKQVEELAKGITFNNRRHTREHESAADSMALELFRNTSFKTEEALNCLALLDSVDNDKYNVTLPLETVFHFPQYPFQKKWVQEEKSLFNALAATDKEEKKDEHDSLKTHPDCSVRIGKLTDRIKLYSVIKKEENPINATVFFQLQELFDYEIIEHCFRNNEISKSLYYTLQLLQVRPDDKYLIANTGRCLNKLYQSQKDHTLGTIIDLPSPWHDEKYNTLLQFIQRVRLMDLAAISYYFLLPYQSLEQPEEELLTAIINSKINFNRHEEKEPLIALYKRLYPHGKNIF